MRINVYTSIQIRIFLAVYHVTRQKHMNIWLQDYIHCLVSATWREKIKQLGPVLCSEDAVGKSSLGNMIQIRLNIQKTFFYCVCGETLEQDAQRSCECHIIGIVQDQVR